MKKKLLSSLSLLFVLALCLSLAGCGDNTRFAVKGVEIGSATQTFQTASFAAKYNHQIKTTYKAGETISNVKVKYIFKNAGGSYYYEEEWDDFSKCDEGSFEKPLPAYENGMSTTYKSTDGKEDLKVENGDILDTMGAGTEVTVEVYEKGEKIAEGSATYQ